ncbi:MAG: ScpA family protein [Candidatus Promineifilaceae bacterium]
MSVLLPTISSYSVHLPAYSGPLDLLLHLIQRNELDITAISLVAVTDQYLQQMANLTENRVERLSDFLVIGARLLVIKSRALLPETPLDKLDGDEEDPAETLARQLRVYKRFKDSAGWLGIREKAGLRSYLRVAPVPQLDRRLEFGEFDRDSLVKALQSALDRAAMLEDSVSVVVRERRVTIEDQIARLQEEVKRNGRVFFNNILSRRAGWLEVSVSLLAVLELIKRHEVNVNQPVLFGPIEIVEASIE